MNNQQNTSVNLAYPGRRTRKVVRVAKGALLVLLTLSSFLIGLPIDLAKASQSQANDATNTTQEIGSQEPQTMGAEPFSETPLPQTVLSMVDDLARAGGVVQSSPDNLTVYNSGIRMRLLGSGLSQDELLDVSQTALGTQSWCVEVELAGAWISVPAISSGFTVLGTNSTGTFVVRNSRLGINPTIGNLTVAYKATPSGSLKWDLEFLPILAGHYRLVYAWSNITGEADISALESSQFRVGYGSINYTLSWSDVPPSLQTAAEFSNKTFSLSIDLGMMSPGSRVSIDPGIASSTSSLATGFSFQRKVFYESDGGYYFVFYWDGINVGYRYSRDGRNWSSMNQMPSGWPAFTSDESSLPAVFNTGKTVIVATGGSLAATKSPPDSPWTAWVSLRFVVGTIAGSSIAWSAVYTADSFVYRCDAGANPCTMSLGIRHVNVAMDKLGRVAFSYNWYLTASKSSEDPSCLSNYESGVYVKYNGARFLLDKESGCGSSSTSSLRSILLPGSESIRVVYEFPAAGSREIRSRVINPIEGQFSPLNAVADTWVGNKLPDNPDANYGDWLSLSLRGPDSVPIGVPTGEERVLAKFNLPSLPNGGALKNATVTFRVWLQGTGRSIAGVLHAAESWNEVNSPGSQDGVTFNHFPRLLPNSVEPNAEIDYGQKPTGSQLTLNATRSIAGYYEGRWQNNGLAVLLDSPASTSFYSREYNAGQFSPSLKIFYVCCMSPAETVGSGASNTGEFSAVADTDEAAHVVYRLSGSAGTVSYTHKTPSTALWASTQTNIFLGDARYPTTTIDLATGDLYAFAIQGSTVVMRKVVSGELQDYGPTVIWSQTNFNPAYLTSNFASASGTSSSRLSIILTAGPFLIPPNTYFVWYVSIPIPSVWSPFAASSSPWDGNGIIPYGEYFSNFDEHVSPSTGTLTIRQTDVRIPSRGLGLEITRIYTQPSTFFENSLRNFDSAYWMMDDTLSTGWTQGSLNNFVLSSENANNGVITVTGKSGATSDDYRYWKKLISPVSTNIYPYVAIRWKTSVASNGLAAGVVAHFNDGTAQTLVGGVFSTSWVTKAYPLTPGKTLSDIEIHANDSPNNQLCEPNCADSSVYYDFVAIARPSIGNGWQFSFPWLTKAYVHLWNGQGYRIPSDFWLGSTGSFENHQGDNFRLTRGSNGVATLFSNSGISYTFDTNKMILLSITDTSTNTITFTYDNYARLANIRDSFSRGFQFGYDSNVPCLVVRIDQLQNSGIIRTIYYTYDDKLSLIRASDSLGPNQRVTSFSYESGAAESVVPWLLTRVTYPTSWYTNYTYVAENVGTEFPILTYRVGWQSVHTDTDAPIRQFGYDYIRGPGDQVIASTVKAYEATSTHTSVWAEDNDPGNPPFHEWDSTVSKSGRKSLHVQSAVGPHRTYWEGGPSYTIPDGSRLQLFLYLPSGNPPDTVQVQVRRKSDQTWFRVHWGPNPPYVPTLSKYLGILPVERDQWIRLEIDTSAFVGAPADNPANSQTLAPNVELDGFALALNNGEAWCDSIGVDPRGVQFSDYTFSFAGITRKVSDSDHHLASAVKQYFGAHGEVINETSIVTGTNPWLWTKVQPANGWNLLPNWAPASTWTLAEEVQTFGAPPWGTIPRWEDKSAKWIWWNKEAAYSSSDEPVWFRRVFNLKTTTSLVIEITADDSYQLYLDGELLKTDTTWEDRESVTKYNVSPGPHVLAIYADNVGGNNPAGLLVAVRKLEGGLLFHTGSRELGGRTSYYRYDLWGNPIYSSTPIDASSNWYHEKFAAYYNNGLPFGFYSFADTLSLNNGKSADSTWYSQKGYWVVKNGSYNGTWMGGPVEETFSWSDVRRADLSLQSRIYVGRLVNNVELPRFGVFTHYAGTGASKWALVIRQLSSNNYVLELRDDAIGAWLGDGDPAARMSCPLTMGSWYTFNMTIRGTGSIGWARADSWAPSQPTCSVQGSFGTSSISASSTGFGLYAGGYSAKFDDVLVSTANPYVIGTGFSNAFITTALPGSNIHVLPAGTAEIGNATSQTRLETYYSYYASGRLKETKSRYDTSNGLQWITTSRTYDLYGNLASETDPLGTARQYEYASSYGNAYLTKVTWPDGATFSSQEYGYNAGTGTVAWSRDPKLYTTNYQYDILNRVSRTDFPNGDFVTYNYFDSAKYVELTNENQWKTRLVYDGLGRQIRVERLNVVIVVSTPETVTYEWANRVATRTDALQRVTGYAYDTLGRLIMSTSNDGSMVRFVYDDLAGYVRYTDEAGIYRCNMYDGYKRLVSVIENADPYCNFGTVTNYRYDEVGNLAKSTNSNLQSTTHFYDSLNRLTRTTYPDFTTETYTYDANGNVRSKVDRNAVTTLYDYYHTNRLKTITYCTTASVGPVTSNGYTYDPNGNLLTLESPNGTLTYAYDSRNRVTSETYEINKPVSVVDLTCPPESGGGGGGSIAYGTLITMADGSKLPVQGLRVGDKMLGYDVVSSHFTTATVQELKVVDTTNMLVINTEAGTPIRVDANPAQTLWTKTSEGDIGWLSVTLLRVNDFLFHQEKGWVKVTGIEFAPKGSHVMFDIIATMPYFASGYLDPQVKGGSGRGSRPGSPSYSTNSAPPGNSPTRTYTVGFAYLGEALDKLTYPDGILAKYYYDAVGRPVMVCKYVNNACDKTLADSTRYFDDDRLQGTKFGNGLTGSYTYDSLGRPDQAKLTDNYMESKKFLDLNYDYFSMGSISHLFGSQKDAQGTLQTVDEQYQYDVFDRLTSSTLQSGALSTSISYQYDNLGNRAQQTVNGAITNFNYNVLNNQLTSTTNSAGVTANSYAYYLNGDLGTVDPPGPTNIWYYKFNVAGQLLTVRQDGSPSSTLKGSYGYDGLGRRVVSVEGSSTSFYAYLGTETLYERSGSTDTDYVYFGGLRIAKISGSTYNYYHTDHLGSTRLVTDSSQNVKVLFSNVYQPFGQNNGNPTCQGTCSENHKFTGKPYSSATGLYYHYQRWYDNSTGRFISEDPLPGSLADPQSLNPYVYVENTPTTFTDSTGMMSDYGPCTLTSGWGSCFEDATMAVGQPIGDWYRSLSPEGQQVVQIGVFAGLTFATGGLDLLAVGAIGFGIGAGGYLAYSYATGTTPTLLGELSWGTLGFMGATAIATLPGIGPRVMSTLGLRSAQAADEIGGIAELSTKKNPKWPSSAQEMDQLLGIKGRPIPGATGGKMTWQFRNAADEARQITGHSVPGAVNPAKQAWHWHYEPGHYTGYPGDEMPDWLVAVLRGAGII